MVSKQNGVGGVEAEGARRATGGSTPRAASSSTAVASTQVEARPKRRTFTAAYKLDILRQTDGAEDGQIGAILRREGLYSSHLTTWRRERDAGALAALGKRRGRKSKRNPLADENEKLKRQVARLQARVDRAELVIEVQKKVAGLLGIPLDSPAPDESVS